MKTRKIDLIMLTLVLVLLVLFVAVAPALARDERNSVIECEAGAEVIQLSEGRIRVIGNCSGVEPVRDEEPTIVYSPYDEVYPDPEVEVYPDPGNNACDIPWLWGESCP